MDATHTTPCYWGGPLCGEPTQAGRPGAWRKLQRALGGTYYWHQEAQRWAWCDDSARLSCGS